MKGCRLLIPVLAVSLAFNTGFICAFAFHRYKVLAAEPPCLPGIDEASPRFVELSVRLQQELEPLRRQQAGETRRLAELIAADEPDRQALEQCLDRLAATGRDIHGLVVETVLAQREVLPADQRQLFCRHVHRRLCDPWIGCEATCNHAESDHQDEPVHHHEQSENPTQGGN